jgi:hypothetical protein
MRINGMPMRPELIVERNLRVKSENTLFDLNIITFRRIELASPPGDHHYNTCPSSFHHHLLRVSEEAQRASSEADFVRGLAFFTQRRSTLAIL